MSIATIIAKPVLQNKLWILTDGQHKIGNIAAGESGIEVKINNSTTIYGSLDQFAHQVNVKFESELPSTVGATITDFPTDGKIHNVVRDVIRGLQLYTKTADSRCYHAAGWFNIKAGDRWTTVLCPKYIYVRRYPWSGPWHTQKEAETMMADDKYKYG